MPDNAESVRDLVVWDLTQTDSTGPHFGPMTSHDAARWQDQPNFHVQRLSAQNDGSGATS